MSRLRKIEDVARPEVGKTYMVPCIYHEARNRCFWPIIGPWHEDAEIIGFKDHHFHFDLRFMPERMHGEYFRKVQTFYSCNNGDNEEQKPRYRRMKMLNQGVEFPPIAGWRKSLEKKYKDARMTCLICPHRGMPLRGQPVKDGVVVCNGHGLAWNVETGAMVPR